MSKRSWEDDSGAVLKGDGYLSLCTLGASVTSSAGLTLLQKGAGELQDFCCWSRRGGEACGCQELQHVAARLLEMGPRREA